MSDERATPHEPTDPAFREAYRGASSLLDESPAARVRAAVLAEARAAARARPTGTSPFRGGRWPLSIAAALVVSVMTGLVAHQALRDDADRVTSASAPATASVAKEAPAAPRASAEPGPTSASTVETQPPGPGAPAPRPRAAGTPHRKPAAADKPATHGEPTPDTDKATVPDSAPAVPAAQPTPFPGGPPLARSTTVPAPSRPPAVAAPAAAEAARGAADAAPAPVAPAAPPPVARTPFAVPAPAPAAPLREARLTINPNVWIARIVALRRAGRDDDADRELEAFRRRYPDFAIPKEAQRVEPSPR